LDNVWASYLAGKKALKPIEAVRMVNWARAAAGEDARYNNYDYLLSDAPHSIPHSDDKDISSQLEEIAASYLRGFPQYSDFSMRITDTGVSHLIEVYGVPKTQAPVIVTNKVDDWTKPIVAVQTTTKINENEPILSTPKPPVSGESEERRQWSDEWPEPEVLVWSRPVHEHWTLRNVPSGNESEKG
jgi:hypothetical protein